ncbi:hypothetical protein [Seohaeicola zhoushanensis]|uniref:Uncharacterized protein n=1 Tax=Seohaeicola zhoushanensis TaxID=1569283 RepID=A0A8J3H3Z4_9RHOB|nr:hypothetical protein [Seohaeicola zhoushanensis]GHF74141.1 hypothetical protein GCM10017056_51100 [Seohaeicola zhoushanensis]
MLSFLDLLGTIGGSILGLPGIFGVAFGMMTRNWLLGGSIGGLIGLLSAWLMGGSHSTYVPLTVTEYVVAITVGILAGLTGSAIRRRGATV